MIVGAAIAAICLLVGWMLGLSGYQVGLEEGRKAQQQKKKAKP
jgi:hypothetical protein